MTGKRWTFQISIQCFDVFWRQRWTIWICMSQLHGIFFKKIFDYVFITYRNDFTVLCKLSIDNTSSKEVLNFIYELL